MPVIVKPTEVLDQPFGVDSDTSKDNGIAEYGSNDYKARTVKVKVAVYATDGSSAGSKVNTDIAKLLGIPCKQNDGYYPIGVIEIDKNLVTGRTPYINTEKDWEEVKAAIEKIDTEDLTNNTVDNVNNVAGSENKENTIAKNLDKVQVDLKHEAGSHKTALFTWKGDSQNIRGNYKYHLDLRFATVTLTFTGVKENGETVDMGSRIYLKGTEILKPGTSDDFYLENIPEDYQIAGYYTTYSLNEEYTFGQAADKDTTIYVKLEEKPVQITYDLNGGNLNGDIEPVVYNDLKVGDNMRTPSDPKREGYTFKGWKDKDGKSPSQQVTGDVTYTAQWEQIPDPEPVQSTDVYVYFRVVNTNDENVSIDGLSVKYNANAGGNTWCTFGKISTTKELTLNNVKQDAETQLTATNAQIHTDNAGIKDKVLSNVTWYQLGTWAGAPGYHDSGTYWHLDGKITGYTVTYASEGTPQNMPQNDVKYYLSNTTYTISNTVPTRTGYTFAGWKSNITNDNKTYKADGENTSITIPKQNVVLTAQWTPNTHKVTYTDGVDNKEVFPDVVRDVNYKSEIPVFGEQNPVRTGYTFAEWTSSVEGVQPGGLMPNQDVTFTATWNPNANTKYVVEHYQQNLEDTGYTLADTKKETGTTGNIVNAVTKSYPGFTYDENNALNVKTGAVAADGSLVLKLYYTRNSYKVSYKLNDFPYSTEKTYKYGKTVTKEENPTIPEGNSFSGWAVETEGVQFNEAGQFTMPAKDVIVVGTYATNRHTYTIKGHLRDADGKDIESPEFDLGNGSQVYGLELSTLITETMKGQRTEAGKNYVYVPSETTVTVNGRTSKLETTSKLTANDTVINLYYYLDETGKTGKDKENKPTDKPDGIPDAWQHKVTFKVVNGKWNDDSSDNIVVYVNAKDKDGKTLESKLTEAQIPAVGEKPNSGYRASGSWDKTLSVGLEIKGDTEFTYTYSRRSSSGGSSRPSTPTVTIPDDVPTGLNGKDHYAYIIGYGNNDVRPQNNITRAEVATIFFRLLTDETREANMTKSNSYNDVKDGDWFCCAVSTLSKMGIIKGYEDGSFKPNDPISRAEFAAIAARFDPDGDKTPASFFDVTSHWAKDEISIAANHGWIKGYEDGSFKPDQKITRAETMTLVNRVLNRLPETKDDLHKDMKTWVDNMDETAWYYLAVQEATNSHYFKNKTGTKFEQWTDLRDTRDWSELEK
ncbi:MAG: S-layer homology domain-containing protein [Evtepia sp.]|nr:S-layer homology domain-containing protein [Evtepia sp.]